MKTVISLAVTAALISSASSAMQIEANKKYDILNQHVDSINTSSTATFNKQQSVISGWVLKLRTNGLLKQSKLMGVANAQSLINQSQEKVTASIGQLGSDIQVVATTSNLINTIIVKGDEQSIKQLSQLAEVEQILPLYDFELDVADSADYIKATQVITDGISTGKGQTVAVLDTGVDYTHKALGGSGDITDYEAAVAAADQQPTWPQGKIIGGYDFVNNDPNPIDADTAHGTHVSHSVTGIAPDVELYVYSVCARFCSGVAQIQALEAAMDPNGDGDISDRVDTVNMSLGGDFGDNDGNAVEVMLNEMAELGINIVISAGNDGPTPFIVGGPSTTYNALSVGAMTHPTNKSGLLDASLNNETLEAQASSFNPSNVFEFTQATTPVVYPTANQEACDPFDANTDFTDKAVVVDRGSCAFTQKVLNAQANGADFVLIANHTAGAGPSPVGGSAPGIEIPSVGISKEDGDIFKASITADSVDYNVNSTEILTTGALATFTSRGPSLTGRLKPEITAPGTSILTAHPGLGDELTPISGTSFSSPITAGAASLVREAHPDRNSLEIKATLMNSANLDVTTAPISIDPDTEMAPISYIGSGLVDVQKAVTLPVAAWDKSTNQAALSLGALPLSDTATVTKTLSIKNFSSEDQTYQLALNQRYQNDQQSQALTVDMPNSVTIPAGVVTDIEIKFNFDPKNLPAWTLNSTSELFEGQNATTASEALTLSEYDGSIDFMDGETKAFHVVYHTLPKPNANLDVSTEYTDEGVKQTVTNTGATDMTGLFALPLTAVSPKDEMLRHDLISASTELVNDNFCDSGFALFHTVVMDKPILHPMGASYNIDFDTDNDDTWDFTTATVNYAWFGSNPNALLSFTKTYGTSSGALNTAQHMTGNNFITQKTCLDHIGLMASDVNNKSIAIRYRVEESSWAPVSTGTGDETLATFALSPSGQAAMLVNAEDEQVSALAMGESVTLTNHFNDINGIGYILRSEDGGLAVTANNSDDANSAPMLDDASFMVKKGTAGATVLGQIMATDNDPITSPVAEYITLNSNSNQFMVTSNGTLKLANNADINQYLDDFSAQVIAVDTRGNKSAPATISVVIENEMPTTAPDAISVEEGNTVTLNANGMDSDGDSLTYTWTQTGGTSVSFENGSSPITFTAPDAAQELVFEVVASDGRLNSEPQQATVQVTHKSGGSLGLIGLLLLPLSLWRRRKQVK